MLVDIFNVHENILADLLPVRRPKLRSRRSYHEIAIADRELRVGDPTAGSRCAQALAQSKGSAEPLDCFVHILVDQNRYDSRSGRRPVHYLFLMR